MTIKAISVSGLGVASKVASKTVTVSGSKTDLMVQSLTITGQSTISPGKSATYKATVLPAKAKNKTITWSVSANDYVTINAKTGKVTVNKNATSGSFVVKAKNEASGRSASYTVRIAPATASVIMSATPTPKGGGIVYNTNANRTPKQINMASVTTAKWSNTVSLRAVAYTATGSSNGTKILWSSSNVKVAKVEETSSGALVTGIGAGTATITAKADDGSGKTAKVTIKVTNPASRVTVVSSSQTTLPIKLLGVGKTVKNKAVFSDSYGKPSSTKVTWRTRIFVMTDLTWMANSQTLGLEDLQAHGWDMTNIYSDYFTVNSSGAVTAKKTIAPLITLEGPDYYVVYVEAAAKEDPDVSGGVCYVVTPLHKKLQLERWYYYPEVFYIKRDGQYIQAFDVSDDGYLYRRNEYILCNYLIKNNNPKTGFGEISGDSNGYMLFVLNSGEKAGTQTSSITATDGSGKRASGSIRWIG